MSVLQRFRNTMLRIQGVDPDEFKEELRRMDEAKRQRDEERAQAERNARRRYLEAQFRLRGGK